MSSRFGLGVGAAALIVGGLATATPTQAQPAGVNVGMLTCNVAGGWGLVFGSSKALNCIFSGSSGRAERYSGVINKFGVDIGYTQGGVIVWGVVAPSAALTPGALTGTYAGATAGATVGVGVTANALVGGNANSIALQPVSIGGNQGFNVAAGIGSITLRFHPR